MSLPASPPPPGSPVPRISYSGGQIAMLVIGGLLLLPGICSLLFAIGALQDAGKFSRDPIMQMMMILWAICFAISTIGIVLIVVARRRARSAP